MQPWIDSTQMALAFVNSRKFLSRTIVGATSMDRVNSNSETVKILLFDGVMQGIQAIHDAKPKPSP